MEAQARLDVLNGRGEIKSVSRDNAFDKTAADFIRWCQTTEYRSKPNTAGRLKTSFASLVAFFQGKPISAITSTDIEEYKQWRIEKHGIRDVTLRHDLHALQVFFRKYAVKRKLAASNPVLEVSKPSDKDAVRIHVLTSEEESAYFAQAEGFLYDIARLILLQGCRPEEIMALQQSDIDLSAGTMRIRGGKTRAAQRTLGLVSESIAIFTRRLQTPDKWVFPSPRRKGEHIKKINGQHDEACREAGVSFVPYDLRHTFATRLATEAKIDLPTLAALLGHSSLRVLHRYIHPTADAQRDAMKRYEQLLKPRLRLVK